MQSTDLYKLMDDEEITIKRFDDEIVVIATLYSPEGVKINGAFYIYKDRAENIDIDYLGHAFSKAIRRARKEYEQKFGPKIVRCIDEGYNNMHYPVIIHGDTYEVVYEDHDTYMVKTDDYGNLHLPKYLFKPLNFEQKEG